MGTISKGILGGFSGTVGTVIGGSWKGIEYMRSQPSRRSGTTSPAQLDQQLKFALVIKFIQAISGVVTITFRNYAVKMTGANNALSYNLKNAVTGVSPDFMINYALALVARGDLPNGASATAVPLAGGKIKFTWVNNAGTGKAKGGDKAVLVVYCEELNQSIYTTGSETRSALTETLDVAGFTGKDVETYISFLSEDGKDVATSIYTGKITVI